MFFSEPMCQAIFTGLEHHVGGQAGIAGKHRFNELLRSTIHDGLPAVLCYQLNIGVQYVKQIERAKSKCEKTQSQDDKSQPQTL